MRKDDLQTGVSEREFSPDFFIDRFAPPNETCAHGLSFSGKTTLARKIVERLQCAYISLGDINAERGLLGRDGIAVEEWERTHALARERLAIWMVSGKDAVVDGVNNLRWLRDRWRAAASSGFYSTVVIYLDIPPQKKESHPCQSKKTLT